MPKPALTEIASGGSAPPREASNGVRPVYFSEARGWVDTATWQRERLLAGNVIAGPALVEEYASTTVVLPGDQLTVDRFGHLVIEVGYE
jgi:N-methylhydantoinase A